MIAVNEVANCIIQKLHLDMTQQISFCISFIAIATLLNCAGKKENTLHINYLGQPPPGMEAKLFAPGLISTNRYEHSAPAFSPDGGVVLWTVVDKNYRA